MRKLVLFLIAIITCLWGFGFIPITNCEEVLQEGKTPLPIVMYHNVCKSKTGKYTVTPKQLEEDFAAIKKAGFETVFMSQVIDWVDGKGTLPRKPLVITFDDGNYNNLHYGLPLAKKYGIKFMINPVTSYSKFSVDNKDCSNPDYSNITWSQIGEAHLSGHVEFGNHTHAMHKFKPRYGIAKKSSESMDTYIEELRKDIEIAQHYIEASGSPRPSTFAYPFGKYTPEAKQELINMGFRAFLTCNERVDTIVQFKPESLYELGRYNRDGGYSTEKVMKLISRS